MNLESIFSQAFVFFLLMDPLGNIPVFLSILKDVPSKRLNKVIFRELIIALAFIIGFYFIGEFLMHLLKVEDYTLKIAGGVILFLIALKMIFKDSSEKKIEKLKYEPFIVPLAIPLVAGPAILSAVMINAQAASNTPGTLSAIFIAWGVTTPILLTAGFLQKILGEKGLDACERLMGLILILLSIQMILDGIKCFSTSCNL